MSAVIAIDKEQTPHQVAIGIIAGRLLDSGVAKFVEQAYHEAVMIMDSLDDAGFILTMDVTDAPV